MLKDGQEWCWTLCQQSHLFMMKRLLHLSLQDTLFCVTQEDYKLFAFFSHFLGKEELNPWDRLFMKEKFLLLRNRNGNLGLGQTFLLPCLWHHFRIHLHPVLLTELRPFHDDLVKLLHLGSSVHTPVRDNRVDKESWVRENGIPEMIFRIRRVSAFGTF